MPRATQISLHLNDEIGTLARLCRDLAERGVNLLALSATEGDDRRGIVHLVVANRELAIAALTRGRYRFDTSEILFIEIKNKPGALARAIEKLARAGINIRSAYATAYTRAQKTAAVISVAADDLAKADRSLGR